MSLQSKRNDGDDIVISGISGVFPLSRNIKEFEYNLNNKVNMVNDDESRWKHTNPNIPRFSGTLHDLCGFDATFFGVHQLQADNMDPQNRLLIEESFKCVVDAGVNPNDLRGQNTGVYVGACVSESESYLYYHQNVPSGFGITGCSKAMFANRISYSLGLNGPSMLCDTTCSSSMYALNLAYRAFKNGEIDSAIVGGANLCMHPNSTLQFCRLGVLSPDGFSCPFDADANGYNRSEAVGCIFLQRKSAAKRVYATLVHCDTNCDGYKAEGMTYPSGNVQELLLKTAYSDINFDVNNLGYFEAHCSGTIAGDVEECKAIDNVICQKRNEALLVGSVKSNCGHTEPASGITSIAKVIFTMQNNMIPPNINFKRPRAEIEALRTGRLKVVVEPTPLPKPYVGINSFGFGGANAHALLKQFEKRKTIADVSGGGSAFPRLVTWSGRTEEIVNLFFDDLEQRQLDPEYLALAQSAQAGGIQGMVFRGFSILSPNSDNNDKPTAISKTVQHYGGVKRPVVWVFSGMGSQWVGMGKVLMQIPLFRQSIQRSHNTLKPSGLDLINVITSDDPQTFENILHSFVGIAAMQIALVDILRALNVTPDFIIGHSVGELGCAYADNCMTAEQMILAAYYRGKVSVEGEKIKGSMAAVGLCYKDVKPMLPESIEVACHNSSDSCTISGPCEDVASFVQVLKSKNIFAREVACSNIAYHSRYIAQFGPDLLKYLRHILPKPMLRSNKWISTSVPKSKWLTQESKYSSAEYHTNNLLNSVLFEESSTFIPKNALTIEIAPHALLQSILKNSISGGIHVGLTRRNAKDNILVFLEALGTLYLNGLELSIDKLYPAIDFPVSRGTPSLSHLIDFDHSHPFFAFQYKDNLSEKGIETFSVKLSDDHQYLGGYEIDGRVLIPPGFYLECVWKTFANSIGVSNYEEQPIEFENVSFVRATPLSMSTVTELVVTVQKGSGKFEVTESHSLVVSGFIREMSGATKPVPLDNYKDDKAQVTLQKEDFYNELRLRGYQYNNDFQTVEMAESNGGHGQVKWSNNWVTFIDAMLQIHLVGMDTRNLVMPSRFRFLRIYPQHHLSEANSNNLIHVYANPMHKRIAAGGIEIFELIANTMQRRKLTTEPILEKYQFIPYFSAPEMSLANAAKCAVQLVLENNLRPMLKIIDFTSENINTKLIQGIMKAVDDLPTVIGNFTVHLGSKDHVENNIPRVNFISSDDDGFESTVGNIIITTLADMKGHLRHLENNGFIFIREKLNQQIDTQLQFGGFTQISYLTFEDEALILLKKSKELRYNTQYLKISAKDNTFQWLNKLKELKKTSKEIVLVSENEPANGILGFINCLRKETDWSNIKCIVIDDVSAPSFAPGVALYEQQLRLDLTINVFKEGHWGSYRHLKLEQRQPVTTRADHVYGSILQIGNMSSIKWLQGPGFPEPVINVVYSSLNFRDVMLASGRLPTEVLSTSRAEESKILGFEFSGIDKKTNTPVMGMSAMGAISSHITNDSPLIWNIPKNWSLREAATVPVAYTTVYYAFFSIVDIRKGKSILIHAGSGGVGIAAIRVALAYGLEVFTTVSSTDKKQFLLSQFPTLKESHIGNSRDTSFEDMVTELTNGKGVDFVLNSLSEDKLIASVRCLGARGHFLEIGKFDMACNNNLGLGVFLNELSFHAVLADSLITADKGLVKAIKDQISDDIKRGIIQPLPSTVFAANDLEKAFKYLGSGSHTGKILVQVREDVDSAITLPMSVLPRTYFNPSLVYVVPGGLSGLGLELTDWMVIRGARRVVLNGKEGITNSYQKLRIMLWQRYGCKVAINTSDISSPNGCVELLNTAMEMGQVGGIFNLLAHSQDSVFINQTVESFNQAIKPKAIATKNLDEISRKLCPKLKHFVVFSSFSSGRGREGQTNFGMANSIIERLIEDRVAHGLSGKAIQWGLVDEATNMQDNKNEAESDGIIPQKICSCLDVLDTLLTSHDAIVSSMMLAEKSAQMVGQTAVDFVLHTAGIEKIESIATTSTLAEIGIDSLKGVEIKQALEREYDILLSPTDLKNITLSRLVELSENSSDSNLEKKFFDINYSEILRMFYGSFETNSLNASTLVHVNDVNTGTPIVIVPGMDGCSSEVWRKLGKQLKAPAYLLQFQTPNSIKTIELMVDYATKEVASLLHGVKSNEFHLIAYSFGAMIAQPVMELLEKSGFSGKAIFIDGSLNWVESLIESMRAVYTPDELEKKAIAVILNIVCPKIDIKKIERNVRNRYHREDWMQYVCEVMRKNQYENDVIHKVMGYLDTLLQKVRLLQDPQSYKAFGITESQLLLLKPTKQTVFNIDDTFGLTPYSRNVIKTETLEGDHKSILCNRDLPNIVNKFFKYV